MNQCNKGYIALISVLIISATVTLIAISANLFSIGESRMGLQKYQARQSFYLATACAEDALMKLKNDLGYRGDETLIFEQGSCIILAVAGQGNRNRTIKTKANAFNQIRKIKIEINRVNPKMEITSWREVADF